MNIWNHYLSLLIDRLTIKLGTRTGCFCVFLCSSWVAISFLGRIWNVLLPKPSFPDEKFRKSVRFRIMTWLYGNNDDDTVVVMRISGWSIHSMMVKPFDWYNKMIILAHILVTAVSIIKHHQNNNHQLNYNRKSFVFRIIHYYSLLTAGIITMIDRMNFCYFITTSTLFHDDSLLVLRVTYH